MQTDRLISLLPFANDKRYLTVGHRTYKDVGGIGAYHNYEYGSALPITSFVLTSFSPLFTAGFFTETFASRTNGVLGVFTKDYFDFGDVVVPPNRRRVKQK